MKMQLLAIPDLKILEQLSEYMRRNQKANTMADMLREDGSKPWEIPLPQLKREDGTLCQSQDEVA